MIKFVAGTDPNKPKLVGLGLTYKNLELLRAGKPIHFSCAEFLYGKVQSIGPEDQLFIFAGADEDTMKAELERRFDTRETDVKDFRKPEGA